MLECYKVEVQLKAADSVRRLEQFFTVREPWDAIQAAVAWAKNRLASLNDQYQAIESLHCWRFSIEEPLENGYIGSRNLYSVFSWQAGDDGSLDEKLDQLHVQAVS
jgi:hypothetical protein